MNHKFMQVCVRLFDADFNLPGSPEYESICNECDANPKFLDNMFYETFGMSAEELIEHYRNGQ